MAKIKLGAFITDIAGKIGGTVFSKNKGGAYAKNKVTPSNPKTSYQTVIRAYMAAVSAAWRGLSYAQRNAFNAAAIGGFHKTVNGDTKILSGHQLHQELNMTLKQIGSSVITSPPAQAAVAGVTNASVVLDDSAHTAVLTYTPAIPATDTWMLFGTGLNSPGKKNLNNQYRYIRKLVAADVSPFDFTTDYAAKFGTVGGVGLRADFKLIPVVTLSGLRGQALSCTTLVQA